MASTFTTGFGIEKIGSGEQDGTWGVTTNHNLDILDRIASYKAVAITTNADAATLTVREASPGAGTENLQDGMYRVIKFTGALDSACTITIAPNTAPAWFIIENATTGSQSLVLTQGSGANVTIQNGKNAIIYCDGAGSGAAIVNALSDLQIATLEVTGAAAIDGALTGASTIQGTTITATTAFVPDASDGAALGTTALEFSDLYLADAAVVAFGDDQDVTLTHVADTGLLLNSTMKLQFNDSSQFIHGSSAAVLSIGATDEIDLTATAIDINGTVDVSGNSVLASVDVTGVATAATFEPDGDTSASDNAAIGYTSAEGLILTGQGSTNDVTIKNDADAAVISVPTGTTNVTIAGDLTISGDDLTMATNTSGAALIADGTNFNPVVISGDISINTSGVAAIGSGVIVETDIADNAVTLAKMAGGTDGNIISFDASGNPVAVATGTDGQVLTSAGAGAVCAFEDAGASNINGLSDALVESNSLYLGNDPSGTTDTASKNVAVGTTALDVITTGDSNVAIGYDTLTDNTTGSYNIAIGDSALANTTTGAANVAVGYQAMLDHTTGLYNVAMGGSAGANITTGANNTIIGQNAGETFTTTSNNTLIGYQAGSISVGENNTFLGHTAGDLNTTGANNIVIGYQADPTANSTSNEITLGNTSITKFRIPGLNFVIKDSTATDNYVLTVDGSGEAGWEAAGGSTDWEVIHNSAAVSAGTYIDISAFKMVRIIGVHDDAVSGNSGINLSTSGDSNSGVATSGFRWRTSSADTGVIGTAATSPSTSALYWGSNSSAAATYLLDGSFYGLDETNVGIMLEEGPIATRFKNKWFGQTTAGSSTWFLHIEDALDFCLVIGVK